MKFVNLDESEIIEQPLEKVIARPDYSPIEFGYDNLCSLDSVSVDGIHPSGGDSDLILPPSVNKINSCFKSEYFKISNLFSEIQTYEQKQEALKNLGILDTINNSTYIHDLGRFDKQVDAEEAAVKVANDSNIIIMLYHIGSQNGIILQQVGDTITKQILLWDNTIFQRHINFSDSSKTQVSLTSYWWKLGATHISYDPDTRKFHLQDMNYNNLNPTVDSKVPLASSTLDGFMSKELVKKLESFLSTLSTKLDALSPGDGITMMNNTVSTLIGNGLTYNGREIVIDHDLTLKTNNGKLGVNAGDGLYVNPDNELGINIGKGLAINHTDSTVEVAEEVLEEIDSKAPLEGYAPNLKVRFSDGLVGRIETIPHEIGRIAPTAGISVDDNSATIERIKGESVVWNQLLSENNFKVTSATLEDDGDYYKVIPTHASANKFQQRRNVIKDHVYLQTAIIYNTGNVYIRFCNYLGLTMTSSSSQTNASEPTLIWEIKKATETIESYIQIGNLFTLDPYWVKKNSFFLYDLTLMFGAGNEPTTIEEFEARKPLGVSNEYNEGTIVSFQSGDVKSVGFNAFTAENSEAGSIDTVTGLNMTSKLFNRSNFISCVGNTQYEVIMGVHFYEYDADRKFIKYTRIAEVGDVPKTTIITTTDKTRYIRIVYHPTNESSVCIHLVHSGYRNGEYEPYVEDIHPLPDIKSIKDSDGETLFPYGLLSAGSVYDEITATKAIKRIGVVDMGELDWSYTPEQNMSVSIKSLGFIGNPSSPWIPNMLCHKYPTVARGNMPDKSISGNSGTNGNIQVKDSSYTSATDFKAAMSGVLLYYELAEPIEVDLEEPLNMTYEAWDFGSEELVVSEPSTSLKGEIIYHFNAVDRIRENSRAIETLKEHVEERKDDGIELLTNGNLKLTLKGLTKEFMPATPSGDPMHYAYVNAGAEWNDTEDVIKKTPIWKTEEFWLKEEDGTYTYWEEDVTVDHLPKHWYLNGIGDIANNEMREIYNNGRLYVGNDISNLYTTTARTALPSRKSGGEGTPFDLYYLCGNSTYIETIVLANKTLTYASNIHCMFANTRRIVRIFPAISINTTVATNIANPFRNAKTLKECELQKIVLSVSYADCPLIYKRSILGAINTCNPKSAITITLHPDAYVRMVNQPDIIAALEAKNTALAGTGGSISLVSA